MMFSSKKGSIMRHPYATLAVIGLAAAGVVSITEKARSFVMGKAGAIGNMMRGMKKDSQMME